MAIPLYNNISFTGGTYLDEMNATSVSLCKPCPEAKYCQQGSTTDGIDCPAGFFCVGNQASGFQNACPIGTYGPDIGYKSKSFLKGRSYQNKLC